MKRYIQLPYFVFAAPFFLLLCMLIPTPTLAWEGTVVSVHDGDSGIVARADSGERVRIRLHGIDAPELPGRNSRTGNKWDAQPYSKKARDFLRGLLPVGGKVAVMDMGLDKYTRTLAGVINLPDGKVVQEELLKAGYVWVYTKYCKNCTQWRELEARARDDKLGLWRDDEPVPPWVWRKR